MKLPPYGTEVIALISHAGLVCVCLSFNTPSHANFRRFFSETSLMLQAEKRLRCFARTWRPFTLCIYLHPRPKVRLILDMHLLCSRQKSLQLRRLNSLAEQQCLPDRIVTWCAYSIHINPGQHRWHLHLSSWRCIDFADSEVRKQTAEQTVCM